MDPRALVHSAGLSLVDALGALYNLLLQHQTALGALISQLSARVDALDQSHTTQRTAIDVLRQRDVMVESSIESLCAQVDALHDAAQPQVPGMPQGAPTLSARVGALEGGIGNLENRMGNLENRMGNLENCMGNLENRIGNMDDRMGRMEAGMANMCASVQLVQQSVQEMQEMQRSLSWQIARAFNRGAGATTELMVLEFINPINPQHNTAFPRTRGAAAALQTSQVDELLAAFGQPANGTPADRRAALETFIGVNL